MIRQLADLRERLARLEGSEYTGKAGSLWSKGHPWHDVKAYGAKGDGTTDDTTAIQAAINACGTIGGTVFIPAGYYKLTATLNINTKRGIRISGATESYENPASSLGTTLLWGGGAADDMLYIFNSQHIRVDGICFDGAGNTTVRCILVDSDNVRVSKRITLEHLDFRRANVGIQFATVVGGGTQYQVDSNYVNNVVFHEMVGSSSSAIVMSSQNTDLTNIQNAEMSAVYGLRILRGGIIRMSNVGAGNMTTFVSIEGPTQVLELNQCQAESLTYFLHTTAAAPSQLTPIYLNHCVMDAEILLDACARVVSIGSEYKANVTLAANDSEWTSISDLFVSPYTIVQSGINTRVHKIDGTTGISTDAGISSGDDVVIADGKSLEWSDVNLYRSAANVLKTDDSLAVAVGLNVGTATGATAGQMRASGGLLLGGQTAAMVRQHAVSALADDATANLTADAAVGRGLFVIYAVEDASMVVAVRNANTIAILSDIGTTFDVADTDGKSCLLVVSTKLSIKNRRGSARDYYVNHIGFTAA
jgi:hypothetical protein